MVFVGVIIVGQQLDNEIKNVRGLLIVSTFPN